MHRVASVNLVHLCSRSGNPTVHTACENGKNPPQRALGRGPERSVAAADLVISWQARPRAEVAYPLFFSLLERVVSGGVVLCLRNWWNLACKMAFLDRFQNRPVCCMGDMHGI